MERMEDTSEAFNQTSHVPAIAQNGQIITEPNIAAKNWYVVLASTPCRIQRDKTAPVGLSVELHRHEGD